MKKIFAAMSIALLATSALAQSGTNSPYSQYGFGVLSDQGNSFNRGMNGVGLALHPHNQINYLNPASYSNIDSLSFIFDAGMSLQMTNFKEGGVSKNANNANFEYAVAGLRIAPKLGVGFGVVPFSNIGYNFSNIDEKGYSKNLYEGKGGIHEVFLGLGWSPVKGLSVGVNGGYLWGELDRSVTTTIADESASSLTKNSYASVGSYKLDFGVQYDCQLSAKDVLTVGATYGLGHNLNTDATLLYINRNTQTSVVDTTAFVAKDAYELPTQISAGLAYSHGTKWAVAVDYSLQQWSKVKFPYSGGQNSYAPKTGLFDDRHKINGGFEYCQNVEGRSFMSRIRYRFGASYTTPYLKINGVDGPSEISVSGGVGIPIMNSINNRSILNVSAQWVRSSAPGLIKENTFRINVGFTFNERWFAKWKFE